MMVIKMLTMTNEMVMTNMADMMGMLLMVTIYDVYDVYDENAHDA